MEVKTKANSLIVTIRDTGSGINPEDQEKIFDPYYRGSQDIARPRGLGLGLALSKWLVELHGGGIWVDSKQGKGTTFSFTVPINEEGVV